MTPERLSCRDLLVIAAMYTFSLLYLAGFPHARLAYPLDDSWIHQVVARNVADDGTLGFHSRCTVFRFQPSPLELYPCR